MSVTLRQFAADVVRTLQGRGFTALFAGGCVRDLLLGRTAKDYDVATSARPEEVREIFGPRRTLAVGQSFGVIVVVGPRKVGTVEVATFRSDGDYHDGRRPASVEYTTPEADAARRDFTINGMFLDPLTDTVYDYVGGQEDLRRRRLRAIGVPIERMTEDKLRLLRAVRFAAILEFDLDEATAAAVKAMAPQLGVVSHERILAELHRMLAAPTRRRAMTLAADLELLPVILPELAEDVRGRSLDWETTLEALDRLGDARFETAFALLVRALPAATVEAICRRLKFSNEEREGVHWLLRHLDLPEQGVRLSPARRNPWLVHPLAGELLTLARGLCIAGGRPVAGVEFCRHLRETTPFADLDPPPLITGADVIGAGLKPGPRFRELLQVVRDAQLDGELKSRDAAIDYLRRLISEPA